MNYRHAYHAGNFCDCMKHALLVAAMRLMARKAAPFAVLDTHAGTGRTALDDPRAERTGEWRNGIGRLASLGPALPTALADWLAVARAAGFDRGSIPGSPAIAQVVLRQQDRLLACELHQEDALALAGNLRGDPRIATHRRDGYEAIRALLPLEGIRRALVLVDPPYEREDEFDRATRAIAAARSRLRDATVAIWHPIKHRAPVRAFHDALNGSGERDLVAFELTLRPPLDPGRLNGCGLVVARPPFGMREAASSILAALAQAFGGQTTFSIETLAGE